MKWALLLRDISNWWFEKFLQTTQALNDFILKNSVIHFVLHASTYHLILEKKPFNHSKGFNTAFNHHLTNSDCKMHMQSHLPTHWLLVYNLSDDCVITIGDKLLWIFHYLAIVQNYCNYRLLFVIWLTTDMIFT